MTSNRQRAAEMINLWELSRRAGRDTPGAMHIVQALEAAGLLMPDEMTEEWMAEVAWQIGEGQTSRWTGHGSTEEFALADARSHNRDGFVELLAVTAVRHVTPYARKNTVKSDALLAAADHMEGKA